MKLHNVRRALLLSFATGLLAAGAINYTPRLSADGSERSSCSKGSLRGDYGFAIDGTVLAGPAPFLLRGVAMTHFDGHGNTSQVDFVTRNGVPAGTDWRPATGTYDVDANCTGSATFSFEDGSPDLHLRLVVVDGGRQVMTTVEGNATGSLGIKVR